MTAGLPPPPPRPASGDGPGATTGVLRLAAAPITRAHHPRRVNPDGRRAAVAASGRTGYPSSVSVGGMIASYGYWAVFGLVAAESLGIPLPGETALIAASVYAGSTHRLNPWLIWLAASAAAIIGDNAGFWIGRSGGYRLARRYGPRVRLDERKLKLARYLFDRHGGKVVFFGRWVSVLRTYAAFLAGTTRMRWRRFLVANASGGIIWAGAYTVTSYLAGRLVQRVSGPVGLILGAAAVVVIAVVVVTLRSRSSDLADRAEAAYPGPLE